MGENRLRDITAITLILSHFIALLLCALSAYPHSWNVAIRLALYITPLFSHYTITMFKRLYDDRHLLVQGSSLRPTFSSLTIGIVAIFGLSIDLAIGAFAFDFTTDER